MWEEEEEEKEEGESIKAVRSRSYSIEIAADDKNRIVHCGSFLYNLFIESVERLEP